MFDYEQDGWTGSTGLQIFQSPMATAAAIGRIVHHSVIAEFDVSSYRTAEAQRQAAKEKKPAASRCRAKK